MRRPESPDDDPFGFSLGHSDAFDSVGAKLAEKARAGAVPGASAGRRRLLYVDLIPSSAWFSNLRAELDPLEWKALQKLTFKKAGYCCEICSGKGPKWPVECHERWRFDVETGVQRLVRLEALCPDCHEATHMGLASVRGRSVQAEEHLKRVNSWTDEQVKEHIGKAVRRYRELSERPWLLDASLILALPIRLTERTRQTIARHADLAARQRPVKSGREALLGIIADLSTPAPGDG